MNTENKLFLFTIQYPYGIGEEYLENELKILSLKFKSIYIFPMAPSGAVRYLPDNAEVINWNQDFHYNGKTILRKEFTLFLKIVLKEFFATKDKRNSSGIFLNHEVLCYRICHEPNVSANTLTV